MSLHYLIVILIAITIAIASSPYRPINFMPQVKKQDWKQSVSNLSKDQKVAQMLISFQFLDLARCHPTVEYSTTNTATITISITAAINCH